MMAPRLTGRPVAYLRKSRVQSDQPGAVSHEAQIEAVRAMGGPDLTDDRILQDWGVSGRKGRDKRPGYDALLSLIEADEVSIVYSYSMSRLARSVAELSSLLELCERQGVPVRTVDREVDTSTATGRLITHVLSAVDQFTAEIAREHSITGVAIARRNGRQIGRPRYGEAGGLDKHGQKIEADPAEDVSVILAALDEAGSVHGASRLLNATAGEKVYGKGSGRGGKGPNKLIGVGKGHPTRFPACPADCARDHKPHHSGEWDSRTISRIVFGDPATGRPGLRPAPKSRARGVRTVATRTFSGLLQCACGDTMTSGHPGYYYCRRGHLDPDHGKPYNVAESAILPKVREWVALLSPLITGEHAAAPDPADVAARTAALDQRRANVLDMFESGDIDKVEKARRLGAIETDRAKIETTGALTGFAILQKVDWAAEPGAVNSQLRRSFKRFELGPDLRPVKAVWHPTLRYGEDGPDGEG